MNIPMASVLRRYRRERNITQETLADALGVTFQSVSRRENGLAYPDVELIPKIAGYFGISADGPVRHRSGHAGSKKASVHS